MRPTRLIAIMIAATAMPALAAPPSWTVDKDKSEIVFAGSHSGQNFEGTFDKWDAAIVFDPADLAHSSAKVTIQTGSAESNDATVNNSLSEAEWFDSDAQPTATFTTSQIMAAGTDSYVASGTLTIKGKSLPVTLPFKLTIAGNQATMTGSTMVDRIAYDLGMQSDASGTQVPRNVTVTIKLSATRAD